jgi:hypothetical protein
MPKIDPRAHSSFRAVGWSKVILDTDIFFAFVVDARGFYL